MHVAVLEDKGEEIGKVLQQDRTIEVEAPTDPMTKVRIDVFSKLVAEVSAESIFTNTIDSFSTGTR